MLDEQYWQDLAVELECQPEELEEWRTKYQKFEDATEAKRIRLGLPKEEFDDKLILLMARIAFDRDPQKAAAFENWLVT